ADLAGSALLGARATLLRGLAELVAGRGDVAGAAAAWAKLPTAAAATWLQTVVHDLVRLRQLGPDAALVNDVLREAARATPSRAPRPRGRSCRPRPPRPGCRPSCTTSCACASWVRTPRS